VGGEEVSRKKLKKGVLITTLDQLAKCEWIIIRDKPYHRGWFSSWQLSMAMGYLTHGMAYEGIRLTNGEYYQKLTHEQIFDRYATSVCGLCQLKNAPSATCEGFYCHSAIDRWKEELVA
jgi:hypothetical protein